VTGLAGALTVIARSDDLVIIQLTVNNTRTLEQKKALYRRIVELLTESPGLRPEDIFINLIEVLIDARGLWGGGVVGGGSAEGGIGILGGGATGSIGGGLFGGGADGLNVGGFVSGGAFAGGPGIPSAGYPCSSGSNFAAGAYAGGGVGGFYTNATDASQLSGPFSTSTLNTPIGSIQVGTSGSIYIMQVTVGPVSTHRLATLLQIQGYSRGIWVFESGCIGNCSSGASGTRILLDIRRLHL
jgi:hypothetical protein